MRSDRSKLYKCSTMAGALCEMKYVVYIIFLNAHARALESHPLGQNFKSIAILL